MNRNKMTGLKMPTIDDIKQLIKNKEIEMIRLEYTDLLGVNRGKLMPATMVDEIFGDGIAFCSAALMMSFDNDILVSDHLSETNDDMKVIGDISTFSILPHCEHTALVLGDLYYREEPMVQAPREFLKRMVKKFHELGLDPIAASELEFFVYNKEDGSVTPYTNQPCTCYQANRRLDPKRFLYKLTQTFERMKFNVLYMNHEYYPGQFEYNWRHTNVLRAADESALFKALSKDIAQEMDLMITFMAKPKNADGGSGCHYHISLNDLETGENICYDPKDKEGLSETMRYFIGGLIRHAKALSPFLAPTINCYKRYQPDSFAPIYVGWGYDNRSTYVRVPQERGAATRLEVRAGSAASNAYLALGSILAAGLDGIQNKIEPSEVITTDLYHDEEHQTDQLPNSLFRALKALNEDDIIKAQVGEPLVEAFVKLKEKEIGDYKKFVTDWEWDTYSYHI